MKWILSVKSYLYTTVRNMSLNYLRDNKRNILLSVDNMEEQETIFEEVVIEEETLALLHSSIEKLPSRSSLIMKFALQGKSNTEISQEMGISVNTVKTLKYKAMKFLKNELKDSVLPSGLVARIYNLFNGRFQFSVTSMKGMCIHPA